MKQKPIILVHKVFKNIVFKIIQVIFKQYYQW